MIGLNPFDWQAAEFLMLYGGLLVTSVIAACVGIATLIAVMPI